jgi:hypothetical protein
MSVKRVAVRLVAEGGRQVQAEFEGVGQAGKQALAEIDARARVVSVALQAAAAAAVVAGGALVAGLVRSGLQSVDAQAKLAQSLGTTTASVQVLERAGELAGVSMGQIEQAASQLTRRLSEAAGGTGPAVSALERLRLSAEDLQKLPLDERIAAIQDALLRYVPEAERAAVASDLFGDRASLVFTRIDGATLARANAELDRFNVKVGEDGKKAVEDANDAISALSLAWTGLSNQLAVSAAPALQATAERLGDILSVTGPVGSVLQALAGNLDTVAQTVTVLAGFVAGRYVVALASAVKATGALTSATVLARGAMIALGGPVGIVYGLLGAAAATYLVFRDSADQTTPSIEAAKQAQDQLNAALGTFAATGAPQAGAEAVAYARNLQTQARAAVIAAEAQLELNQARLDSMRGFPDADRTNPAIPGVQREFEESMAALNQARVNLDNLARTVNGLEIGLHKAGDVGATALEPVVIKADEVNEALRRAGGGGRAAGQEIAEGMELAETAAQGFGDTLAGAFDGLITQGKSMGQVLRQLAGQLESRAWQGLFGWLGGGLSGGFGGLGRAMLPSADGGGYTGDGPRAGGLDGRGGFLAMLHPQETVVDHARGQEPAGGVVRIVIEEAAGFAARVRAEAQGVAVQVVRASEATLPARMTDAQRRYA